MYSSAIQLLNSITLNQLSCKTDQATDIFTLVLLHDDCFSQNYEQTALEMGGL